jgi:Spy/CpxP family protein refolding chaperone
MRKLALIAAVALGVAACESNPADPSTLDADYALVLFGNAGGALETTLGPQGPHAFDGRSRGPSRLPAELALTSQQITQIRALRDAFQAANASKLAALKGVMEKAKAARGAGKTREELRAILVEARPIAESLRAAVEALHDSIEAVLTADQRAWLDEHRRRPRRG